MPEAIPEEAMEFMARFGGATASMIEQLALEWYWTQNPGARGKFPYTRPVPGSPMYSDIIVAGLAIPPWIIGLLVEDDAKKKGDRKTEELGERVREFGEGGVFYTAPMLVKTTAVNITPLHGAATRTEPSRAESREPPAQQAIVYKL